jgi:hypothetical protein
MVAAFLGAALQLTASVAVAARVVVCRAPSGHVEIESGLGDCCGTIPGHDVSASTCDGCTDTPFLQGGVSPSSKATFVDVAAMSPGFIAPAPTWRLSMHVPPLRAADRSARDRSVVLLI